MATSEEVLLPDGLRLRPLTEADVDRAVILNTEAGWNQNGADWRFMLGAGRGTGIEDGDGLLVATSMLQPFDAFAWIAMILVTGKWQRRGLATVLMQHAIADCEANGWIAGLDATEQGRGVYLPLGFRDIYPIDRMAADAGIELADEAGARVMPLTAANLDLLMDMDRAAFGANRRNLLAHLIPRQPELAFQAADGAGFILAREGRVATQLGPLIARDEATAQELLAAALRRVEGPVFLDLVGQHADLREWLEGLGFIRQRGYVRMLRGHGQPLDDPAKVYLLAGPEIG